ncbi:ExbD/TolR family protein [Ideonella sp.]|jgi:biopolymer transport protein TolR|uniref:ExbD/TolR family protein n=1 Tax=Ideonella sp. TaxID=1929293 RepID=UPI0037C145DB
MAFGRLERPRPSTPMSDINMTPLIDVMLVLLVIFMITAPLMSSSLRLDLPKADGAKPSEAAAVLAVGLDREGRLFIGEQRSSLDELRQKAKEAAQKNPATEVHLRADNTAPYGKVAELIGLLQQAGLTRIGFVAEAKAAP